MQSKLQIKIKYSDGQDKKVSMPKPGDLGLDLYSAEDVTMFPGEVRLISTGTSIQMPEGYALILKDRSSVSKHGHVMAGVIDQSYIGTIKIRMLCVGGNETMQVQEVMKGFEGFIGKAPQYTTSKPKFCIRKGDKIAQAIIVPDLISKFYIEEVNNLDSTERGEKGFGSTGR